MSFFDTFGGMFGGASQRAGAAQEGAAADALSWTRKIYGDQLGFLQPYMDSGKAAVGKLNKLLIDGDASDYTETPGYAFRFNEGQRALERGANARGRLRSGATDKALIRYGQGVGAAEYDSNINRLLQLSGLGSQSTGQAVGAAGQAGQAGGQNMSDMGAARASSYVGANNQLTGLVNNAALLYGLYK